MIYLLRKRADYAVEQGHFDWKEEAVKAVESLERWQLFERKIIRKTC